MSILKELHKQIALVAPIFGVTEIVDKNGDSVYSVDFTEDASPTERLAGQNIIDDFKKTEFLDKEEVIQNRISEYPEITDQLDEIWKIIDATIEIDGGEMLDEIKAIKEKYPTAIETVKEK